MKECQLKRKAKEYFREKGYQVWFPKKVKFHETDIFGLWDAICWRGRKFIFLQISTIKNKSARMKKILNFMMPNNLYFSKPNEGWLMCWRKKERKWEIFKI